MTDGAADGPARVVVEADGGSRGNPGPAGYGALVRDAADGSVLATRSEFLGRTTNNVAEYRGLIAGLEAAAELGARAVDVRMDSKLVIEQMSGRWQVKHPDMKPLARQASALLARFDDRTLQWIPRERNKDADRLANEAMDLGTGRARRPTSSTGPEPSARPSAEPVAGAGRERATPAGRRPVTSPTRLVLVRHGTTADTALGRLSGRGDVALDARGRAEARAVAARLLRELPADGEVAVVASPVPRARETADVVARALGVTVTTDDDLAELDMGAWTGMTPEQVAAGWPETFADWVRAPDDDVRPPGGESLGRLRDRVVAARERITAAHLGATVVLVSHLTPLNAMIAESLGAPVAAVMRIGLAAGSVSELQVAPDGGLLLRLLGAVDHLHGPSS